ncbi:MAG: trigger factor, partial [Ginsengibacter sp.]
MASVTKENLGNLHDKLTVKVSTEDYLPAFEKAIKDYSKKANIPGFRKGMVPAGMVKKMYGASIFYDEVIKSVEKELKNYLVTEKPEIFAQPLPMENDLRKLDMNQPAEYDFPFEIGLKPEVSLDGLSAAKTTF